ncbi:hypothetical protein, partial [Klebsiella michiganensis]|uniref:hypothetical protein n=1 Tax=Klebsiella michiganensis TaxID=1134687 RepID=UPI001CCD6210
LTNMDTFSKQINSAISLRYDSGQARYPCGSQRKSKLSNSENISTCTDVLKMIIGKKARSSAQLANSSRG